MPELVARELPGVGTFSSKAEKTVSGDDGAVAEVTFKVAVDMTVNIAQRDTTK